MSGFYCTALRLSVSSVAAALITGQLAVNDLSCYISFFHTKLQLMSLNYFSLLHELQIRQKIKNVGLCILNLFKKNACICLCFANVLVLINVFWTCLSIFEQLNWIITSCPLISQLNWHEGPMVIAADFLPSIPINMATSQADRSPCVVMSCDVS